MNVHGRRRLIRFFLLWALVFAPCGAGAQTIKLATWNIEHLRGAIGEGPNPRQKEDFDRLAKYAEILNADVIALQEIESLEAAARVFDPAKYQLFIEDRGDVVRTGFAVRRGIPARQNPDYSALSVDGKLPQGTDISITIAGREIRLLSVHLRSGCWGDPLDTPFALCELLRRQVPALEAWIDARAAEGVPFMVLGDFNRRFDLPGDEFWREIDDGKPLNADLFRITQGETQLCWDREFPLFIDHIVFDKQSARWIKPYTFEQIVFQESAAFKKKLSDHCPIAVVLEVK